MQGIELDKTLGNAPPSSKYDYPDTDGGESPHSKEYREARQEDRREAGAAAAARQAKSEIIA